MSFKAGKGNDHYLFACGKWSSMLIQDESGQATPSPFTDGGPVQRLFYAGRSRPGYQPVIAT